VPKAAREAIWLIEAGRHTGLLRNSAGIIGLAGLISKASPELALRF